MALSLTVPISCLYFDDDGLPTETSRAQEVVEENVEAVFEEPRNAPEYRQQYVAAPSHSSKQRFSRRHFK
jgi:hypothetical protein